jgi:predicted RNase H-like nuclease (RuvC/YqgF family)
MEHLLDKFSKQIFELYNDIDILKNKNQSLEGKTEILSEDIKVIKNENELLKEEIELLKKAHAGQLLQEERMTNLSSECNDLKLELSRVSSDMNELKKALRKKFII